MISPAEGALEATSEGVGRFHQDEGGDRLSGRAPSTVVNGGFRSELALLVMNETVSSRAIAPAA